MNLNCSRKVGCNYCCSQKRELLRNDNFEKTLEIYPRLFFMEKAKSSKSYFQTLTIRNTGTLIRKLKFLTEPSEVVTCKINGNSDLEPGSYLSVDITVSAAKAKLPKDRYILFVLSEHPDIIWEIPLIVRNKYKEMYVPEIITLAKVPKHTISYYEFLVYNPREKDIHFTICTNFEGLMPKPFSGVIQRKDFFKILVAGTVPADSITTSMFVNLRSGESFKIFVQMEPSNQLIHLNSFQLTFDDTFSGIESQKKFPICNNSNECVTFEWSNTESINDKCGGDTDVQELKLSECIKIENKFGCVPAMSSACTTFSFVPPADFPNNEEDESPYQINAVAYLFCPIVSPKIYAISISGMILGPKIEITPREVNLDLLYVGQIECLTFDVSNNGPISGEIYYKEHTNRCNMTCTVTPPSIFLDHNSDEESTFQLKFFRREIGKFVTKVFFKIKSGELISIILRGNSLPLSVHLFPEVIELGTIPICVPQEHSVAVQNPLPISIVVEPKVIDDGVENPLILNIKDELNLPLTTRSANYNNSDVVNEELEEGDLKICYSDFDGGEDSSRTGIHSQISSLFKNKVIDDIPAMTKELLHNLRTLQLKDQVATGMKIIDASLDCIFDKSDYFKSLKEDKHYLKQDWKSLPCDVKEVATEEERFHLEPNEMKILPVVFIPNIFGPNSKSIDFQVYPLSLNDVEPKDVVSSLRMVSTLKIECDCSVPILEFNEDIMFALPVFVDMENNFKMIFKNVDNVTGFVFFTVLPFSEFGTVSVDPKYQKFKIDPDEVRLIVCHAMFRKIGDVVLHGTFKLVGKLLDNTFKVEAHVLPPHIEISHTKIFSKLEVLETKRTKFFITNTCPTVAQFSVSLKEEKYQYCEPEGGSLAPGQTILISIMSRFLDPVQYKNVLCINLKHCDKQFVPMNFSVEGAPFVYEPNIRHNGLDFGMVFKTKKMEQHTVKIKNVGKKTYKIVFRSFNSKKPDVILNSYFDIEPKQLMLLPNDEKTIQIEVGPSKEGNLSEIFSVECIDEKNHKSHLFDFETRCIVIVPRISWSKKEISFEGSSDPDEQKCDVVTLTNTTQFPASINLTLQGQFVLGTDCQSLTEKFLNFDMNAGATVEIYVCINQMEIDNPLAISQLIKGLIKCKANNKPQKSLPLNIKYLNPGLKICEPKVIFFTPYADSFSHINVHNCSLRDAFFKWTEVDSIIVEKTLTECNSELNFSKTLSESILSLPSCCVPKYPNFIYQENSVSEDISNEDCFDGESDLSEVSIHEELEEYLGEELYSTSLLISMASSDDIVRPTCKPFEKKLEPPNVGIDEIFKLLGLKKDTSKPPRTCARYRKSCHDYKTEKEEEEKESTKIQFQQKWGTVPPQTMFKAYVFLPTLPENEVLVSTYKLEVTYGQSEFLDCTVTSQKGRIQVSNTEMSLGDNVWHNIIQGKIKITSLSPYVIQITVIQKNDANDKTKRFSDGFVEINSPKKFFLTPKKTVDLDYKAAVGFKEHFCTHIGIQTNINSTAIPIHFHGSGYMPIVIPLNLIKRHQTLNETMKAYLYLREFFNKEFRDFCIPEKMGIKKTCCYADTELEKVKKNNIFTFIDNTQEQFPEADKIDRFIETKRFTESNYFENKFQDFYEKCLKNKAFQFNSSVNMKDKICRPIPWKMSEYIADMRMIRLNETKCCTIRIVFHGPERLYLSCRPQIVIPGLEALFEVADSKKTKGSYTAFHQSPHESSMRMYKNMHERLHDAQLNEVDQAGIQKQGLPNDIKRKEQYKKITPQNRDMKNPLILSEICQTTNNKLDNYKLKLYLKLTASESFYDVGQKIEDYFFIDTHLGPILPILLKAQIKS